MKKKNSLYPIVHIPMFQPGGTAAPEMNDEGNQQDYEKMMKSAINSAKKQFSKLSFGEAFKAARASKDKVFEWRGKKYTTELASEGSKKPSGFKSNKRSDDYATRNGLNDRIMQPDKPVSGSSNNKMNTIPTGKALTIVKKFPVSSAPISRVDEEKPVTSDDFAWNTPLTNIAKGIDWFNERTGDNPLGAAVRFITNGIKAPFAGGASLSSDAEDLVLRGQNNFGAHTALDAVNAFAPAVGKGMSSGAAFLKSIPALQGVLNQSINKLDDLILPALKRKQGYLQRMNNIGAQESKIATRKLDNTAAKALKEAADEEAIYLNHIKNKQGYYQNMNNQAVKEAALVEEKALQSLPKKVRTIANKQKKAELYQIGGQFIPMFENMNDDAFELENDLNFIYDEDSDTFDEMEFMKMGGMKKKPLKRKQAGGFVFNKLKG